MTVTYHEGAPLTPVLPAGDRPYLGDLKTVGGIVQGFVGLVFDAYKGFQRGETTREAAMEAIEAEARRLGPQFTEPDDTYSQAPWHSDGRMKARIRAQGIIKPGGPTDPGEAFFRWLALQAIQAAKDLDTGTAAEQVGPQLQAVLADAVAFLAGARL